MNSNEISIKTVCPYCNKEHWVTVKTDDYKEWKTNLTEQKDLNKIFLYLSEQNIEYLNTGYCLEHLNK